MSRKNAFRARFIDAARPPSVADALYAADWPIPPSR